MPRKCCVDGCESNYYGETKNCSTFSLPKNESLRSQWLQQIPTDFSKLKRPLICIKHFDESSIIRNDVIISNGKRKVYPRKVPKLKKGAVPSIFSNVPNYSSTDMSSTSERCSNESPIIRNERNISFDEIKNTIKAPKLKEYTGRSILPNIPAFLNTTCKPSTSKRLADIDEEYIQQVITGISKVIKVQNEKDTIKCISDISSYIGNKNDLQNWVLQSNENFLMLRYIDSKNVISDVLATISIDKSLDVSVYIKKCKIEKSELPYKKEKLTSFKALGNLMIFLEEQVTEVAEPQIDNIDLAVKLLMQHNDYDNSSYLKFIVEQLNLLKEPKEGRRFCDNTMLFASTLYLHSLSAYNIVRESGLLLMPHPRNVEKLISKIQLT